jgi:hypothetical protein
MAKALFGHVAAGPDPRVLAEMRRLRQRVHELESELEALRLAHAELTAHATVADELISLAVPEPAPALA